ncbi:hypothetical protein BDV25DRAFT_171383 [Aspergillus avenaceus]|uniref:Zn(2)-C6 fungal-type domain-containing protein n=1 Tax=Aspergillus avenaceus TaxID=36643 RepID=A0A5N6TYR2_ASPAV|nr:hypothetical protein BDV25DRAFT_171383 [Aspergillus avenaceus]
MTSRTDSFPDPTLPRKRPRPVVSCLRCREKKLKCDRVSPCQNCTKAGCREDCAYSYSGNAPDPLPRAKRPRCSSSECEHLESRTEPRLGVLEDLQQRVIKLEERLSMRPPEASQAREVQPATVHARKDDTAQPADSPPFLGTLVVKGSRTRYHGQNNRVTLLSKFAEANDFISQCNEDPAIVGLAREVQFLQTKLQGPLNSPSAVLDMDLSPELMQLRARLPAQNTCDRLVEVYFTNFETTFRILHAPTFRRQYEQFWSDSHHESYQTSSPFLPQLTAVMVVSLSLDEQHTKVNDPSAWEYLKGLAVPTMQQWVQNLTRKQRTELGSLQVETLLLWYQRLRLTSAEELWGITGGLVRSAMVMGLHLHLTERTKLSAFQMELRRRLWFTLVEMDLQASITAGMPLMTPGLEFGPAPANINDADMDESASELPPSKPLSEWTDSLTQVTLAMSLSDRIKAMAGVRMTSPVADSALLQLGKPLEQGLAQVPPPLRLCSQLTTDTKPAALLNCVLMDVCLRRPLLCLYRPVVLADRPQGTAFEEIQRSCLDASLTILSYQDYFDPNVAELDIFESDSYWNAFQRICKNDILWAALSVCGCIKHFNDKWSPTYTKASLTRVVENTLDNLTQRIDEPGSNLKDVLLLAVVLQSVRVRGSAQLQMHWMSQGAKKALTACRQRLLPAVAEESFALNLADFAQMLQTTQPLLTPTGQAIEGQEQFPSAAQVQLPEDFLAQSSALATEFNDFQGDPFAFGDGSFAWNL